MNKKILSHEKEDEVISVPIRIIIDSKGIGNEGLQFLCS
jgi:hypothetical protein